MKLFEGKDSIVAAQAHADAGGQALHVWDPGPDAAYSWPTAPKVFKENRPWAHLFDNNLRRLTETARELGVRSVVIDRHRLCHRRRLRIHTFTFGCLQMTESPALRIFQAALIAHHTFNALQDWEASPGTRAHWELVHQKMSSALPDGFGDRPLSQAEWQAIETDLAMVGFAANRNGGPAWDEAAWDLASDASVTMWQAAARVLMRDASNQTQEG